MKQSKIALVFASIFLTLLLVGIVSAEITFSNVPTLDRNGNSATITISSTENEVVNFSLTSIDSGGKTITFDALSEITINGSTPQTITLNYNVPEDFDFEFQKEYSTTLTANGNISDSKTQKISFSKNTNVCSFDNLENFDVRIRELNIIEGIGNDDEWFPLDKIEIEVQVRNRGNNDMDNIEVKWGIYGDDKWIVELDDVEDFDLRDGDDETIKITFTIDKRDLDVDLDELRDGSYTLYVLATGEIVEGSNEGEMTCASSDKNVEIIIERDFVVLRNLEISDKIQCGSQLHISGDVWNIGDRRQDDLIVRIYNADLEMNEFIEFDRINAFDSEPVDFSFMIGEDIESGTYSISFQVLDDNGDVYEARHDDELSSFSKSITISGSCAASQDVAISAVLQEGGKAGKPLVVKATITNAGEEQGTFLLNVAGYASWAQLSELSKSTLVLASGQSEEIFITLDVNKEISGEQNFNIEVLSNGNLIANQPVSVSITESSAISNLINKDNWHIWAIALLNLILVIAIIVVAVKIARR